MIRILFAEILVTVEVLKEATAMVVAAAVVVVGEDASQTFNAKCVTNMDIQRLFVTIALIRIINQIPLYTI